MILYFNLTYYSDNRCENNLKLILISNLEPKSLTKMLLSSLTSQLSSQENFDQNISSSLVNRFLDRISKLVDNHKYTYKTATSRRE